MGYYYLCCLCVISVEKVKSYVGGNMTGGRERKARGQIKDGTCLLGAALALGYR